MNGTIKCSGANASGQIGNISIVDTSAPVSVASLSDAAAVAAGGAHTCAVVANGGVKCGGANDGGQLGNGTTIISTSPQPVSGIFGSIITSGRSEVTALGDEVNEGGRIEACASCGRALVSKALLERLIDDDAAALGIDPNTANYTQLVNLDTAAEKARRDAPAFAVCDIAAAIT